MRTAPIRVCEVSFRRVRVELDVARIPEDGSPPVDVSFDLDRVNIATHVSFSDTDEAKEPGSLFLVLRVVIDNEVSEEDDVRYSPYLVDIEAGAVVRALPGSEVLGDIEDIVVVNGTSVLWSSIREQVCNLTARMPAGTLMLPTVNFQDLRRKHREVEVAPEASPKRRSSTAVKKEPSPRKVK